MKKTITIFAISLFICTSMFLFNIGKRHSMGFEMLHISGDEKVLQDVTFSSIVGDFYGRHFDITVEDGDMSYQYSEKKKDSRGNVYLNTDIMLNLDTSNVEFKAKEGEDAKDSYIDREGNTIETQIYEGIMERTNLVMSVMNYDENIHLGGQYHIARAEVNSGLQIVSTPDNPIRLEKLVRSDESLENAYTSLMLENIAKDSLCFKKDEFNYVGMPNVNPQNEGSAQIYDIAFVESDSPSFYAAKYTSLFEIPITLGTSGFLYVYEDQYIVVLQRENIAQISKYDANMKLIEQVEIPLDNPQSLFTYYAEKELIIIQADKTFTAFDIANMELKDEVSIDETYAVDDCIYRNNKFYFSGLFLDDNGEINYQINTSILVYDKGENVYEGEILIGDNGQPTRYISTNDRYYRSKPLFVRDEL